MADPYRCLRATTIGIGLYNIVYCLAQFGILGWQVKAVKTLQWEYENRQLPATGSIDGFQARFPGLYAIYTETPERRRINAMFAIVLICLGLSIVHLMTTISMLYGAIRRAPNWILPWFLTCAPIVVMCTAYAVLWWSGDVFNEQLTMSVTEFVLSLAINGIAFIVVLLYYLRITGRLTSDRPATRRPSAAFANQSFDYGGGDIGCRPRGTWERSPPQYPSHYQQRPQQQQRLQQQQQSMYPHCSGSAPNYPTESLPRAASRSRSPSACLEPVGNLPPWHEPMPDRPSYAIGRKMRRRERDRDRDPAAVLRQGYKYRVTHPFDAAASLRRQRQAAYDRDSRAQSALAADPQFASFDASYASPNPVQYSQMATPIVPPRQHSVPAPRTQNVPPQPAGSATRPAPQRYIQQPQGTRSQRSLRRSGRAPATATSRSAPAMARRKSPQRVSFKSRPKIYERTPDSSLSGSGGGMPLPPQPILREIHTVV